MLASFVKLNRSCVLTRVDLISLRARTLAFIAIFVSTVILSDKTEIFYINCLDGRQDSINVELNEVVSRTRKYEKNEEVNGI